MALVDGEEHGETKLPVWRMVVDAYRTTFRNLRRLFAVAAVPLVATVIIKFIPIGGVIASPTGAIQWYHHLPGTVRFLVIMLFWSVFAVAWGRFLLLGRRDTGAPVQFRLGRREAMSLPCLLILGIAFSFIPTIVGPFYVPGSVSVWVYSLVFGSWFVAIFLVISRCVLVLPAIAVDEPMDPHDSWRLMKGASWRMLGCLALAYLPIGFLGHELLRALTIRLANAAGGFGPIEQVIERLLWEAVTYLAVALIVAVSVVVFKRVICWRPAIAGVSDQ